MRWADSICFRGRFDPNPSRSDHFVTMVPIPVSRTIFVVGSCSLIWWALFSPAHHIVGTDEIITAPLHSLESLNASFRTAASSPVRKHPEFYASRAAHELCAAHGYSAFVLKNH